MNFFTCTYYITYDGWDVTGYQGLFCLLNKPSYNQLLEEVQLVKVDGQKVFVVKKLSFLPKKFG